MTSPRTVLLIAFHFPPVKGSSGVQRTLRFAQYLPEHGWRPIILTIDPRAYEATSNEAGNEIPAGLEVHRAFGLNASRLSIGGRYPLFLAIPDRWATWRLRAVREALRIVRERRVDALWSTFPIATAHRIAIDVARRTGVPWIAEFRDPMWQGDYPPNPKVNRAWRRLESEIFARADALVTVTRGAGALYRERFPSFDPTRLSLIENGYDEETFARAESSSEVISASGRGERITLLHSGLIYPSERDPTAFFRAVAALKRSGRISAERLRIVLRACGYEAPYAEQLRALDIGDIVRLEPAIDYLSAVREMLTVDGLLVLQAANCNSQVPAKLYEYLRAGKPILALTDPTGDTAQVIERSGAGTIVPLDDASAIESTLPRFVDEIRSGVAKAAPTSIVRQYSRASQTEHLARCLNEVVARKARGGAGAGR